MNNGIFNKTIGRKIQFKNRGSYRNDKKICEETSLNKIAYLHDIKSGRVKKDVCRQFIARQS